ncbi:hypothetical protein AMECASPLE_003279 [Ameca splendens]|uniref:Uncharacterized protein n=1 Tax=Ameca splendens TaxID=208324 RepID=A0ABV0ZJG2_9TELE
MKKGDVEHRRTKHLSYFPDNAAVGALAMMCHSSAGSSGMHRDRLYPFVPVNSSAQPSITWSRGLRWGAVVAGRNMEVLGLKVKRKHNDLFGAWLTPSDLRHNSGSVMVPDSFLKIN